jgi:bifunctional non-homologous end joining protein LigD
MEPAFIQPMQCKPAPALPAGENWTFEIKFDGYRCIVVKRGREVTLFSRHEKVLNRRFPGVVDALSSLDGDFVLDGELVALDSHGKPSFQLLQNSLSQELPIYFYVFDLLNRYGDFGEFAIFPPARVAGKPAWSPRGAVAAVAPVASAVGTGS